MTISISSSILVLVSILFLSGCASTRPNRLTADYFELALFEKSVAEAKADGWNFDEYSQGWPTLAYVSQTPSSLNLAKARLLIKNGANVNARVNDSMGNGGTILHIAAHYNNVEGARLLIENGADVNAVDKSGHTPLLEAERMNRREFIALLVSKGAKHPRSFVSGRSHDEELKDYSAAVEFRVNQRNQEEERRLEQKRRDKAASSEFWRGAATLATGVAVGNSTRNLSSDQQTRMMKSSMEAVDSGDTSGFSETTRQVKAEQAQAHQAKMREIEAEKRARAAHAQRERDRAATQNSQPQIAAQRQIPNSGDQPAPSRSQLRLHTTELKNYRCVSVAHGNSLGGTESEARSKALRYAQIGDNAGGGNAKVISSAVTSCKNGGVGNGYKCYAETKYESDSSVPCSSGPRAPSAGSAK